MSSNLTPVLLDPEKYTWVHTDESYTRYEKWSLYSSTDTSDYIIVCMPEGYKAFVYPKIGMVDPQTFPTLEEAQRWLEAVKVCT